ncbi:hypothetical protein [Streptomyces sp. G-G2]|uniref:hypothetical protein n=1 Tax=Streptomyces sp. G-G2 TaxID=3046201 RepID=UPI0024BAD64D|nr:hypothetical protein [Streptomyces sp. G-G2]MDJ0382678.1 hypothetical protein [Streptomyces sp. G-G2]
MLVMTAASPGFFYASPLPDGAFGFLLICMVTVPLLSIVFLAYLRRLRVAIVLRSYPWQEYTCSYPPRPATSPTIVSIPFSASFEPSYRVTPFPVDLARKQNAHPDRIWFAGDPRFGGVVSPVGGHYPVRVVPARVPAGGWGGGDDALARRVGLMRRGGKGTQT